MGRQDLIKERSRKRQSNLLDVENNPVHTSFSEVDDESSEDIDEFRSNLEVIRLLEGTLEDNPFEEDDEEDIPQHVIRSIPRQHRSGTTSALNRLQQSRWNGFRQSLRIFTCLFLFHRI